MPASTRISTPPGSSTARVLSFSGFVSKRAVIYDCVVAAASLQIGGLITTGRCAHMCLTAACMVYIYYYTHPG
eukprot:COSAG01_NODE_3043_length_6676_cov_21.258933_1_plen_73_part_00